MPLGMEVGLSPGDFVLDGNPAPTPKGAVPHQIFGPRLLWPNGWMDEDAAWYVGTRPRPRPQGHIVLDVVPAPAKGAQQPPPLFSAHVCCDHGRPSQLLLCSCFHLLQLGNIGLSWKR